MRNKKISLSAMNNYFAKGNQLAQWMGSERCFNEFFNEGIKLLEKYGETKGKNKILVVEDTNGGKHVLNTQNQF